MVERVDIQMHLQTFGLLRCAPGFSSEPIDVLSIHRRRMIEREDWIEALLL